MKDTEKTPILINFLAVGGIGLVVAVLGTYAGYFVSFFSQMFLFLSLTNDPHGQSYYSVIPTPFALVPWIPLCFLPFSFPIVIAVTFIYSLILKKKPAYQKRILVFTVIGFLIIGCLCGFLASLIFTPAST
jgi:hypothetical protein